MVKFYPVAPLPAERPSAPSKKAPAGACDAHVHMVAGPDVFDLWEGRVEDPGNGSFEAWLDRYRTQLDVLGFDRGIIVHSILYGTDNTVTSATVEALGKDRFKGVGLVPDGSPASSLDVLLDKGIVGVRLNYVHGGVLTFDGVTKLAPDLEERGMHIQMLMNAHKHMDELAEGVRAMPVDVVFDHIGWPDLASGPGEAGFDLLCQLLSEGACWVKLSGLYRLCDAPYDGADVAVEALVRANPERCLWGSDWPHLMLADARMPDAGTLLDAFYRAVPNTQDQHRILVDNPAKLYRFED